MERLSTYAAKLATCRGQGLTACPDNLRRLTQVTMRLSGSLPRGLWTLRDSPVVPQTNPKTLWPTSSP